MNDINEAMSVACVKDQTHRLLKRKFASTPRSLSFAGAVYEVDVSSQIAPNRQPDV